MKRCIAALLFALLTLPALAEDQSKLDRALADAVATFEQALPRLTASEFGVDVAAYRDALSLQRFQSAYWGGEVRLHIEMRESATGSCGQFAAFVRIPPENSTVRLVLCPQFFSPDADALRELTVLHELVHVVAGANECQAMVFAAKVQKAATGTFTPVDAYWQANGCEGTGYQLPE